MRLSIALLPLLLVLSAPAARAAESFDGCVGFIDSVPAVISTQGVWCLRNDLATALTSGYAIEVAANNVTIDCNGYKVGGLAAGIGTSAVGIGANAPRSNYAIRNCNIRGFARGVQFNSAGNLGGLVEDNRFEGNTLNGVLVSGEGDIVRRNRISDTGGSPLFLSVSGIQINGNAARVEDNTIVGVSISLTNSGPAGITTVGGGNLVSNNFISGVVPNGTGSARGILNFGLVNIYDGNHLFNDTPVAGDGIDTDSDGKCVGNRVFGFQDSAISACTSGGGNVTF